MQLRPLRIKAHRVQGLHYDAGFLSRGDRAEILSFISTLRPIWENRFCDSKPPPEGETQRRLLRPVYWLGNWQFACLDYYRPHIKAPGGDDVGRGIGLLDRCVQAEPFPAVLNKLVALIETRARRMFKGEEMPAKWHLNTCLVNFYGSHLEDGKWVDVARVGEHKDFEPGPGGVDCRSGERALIQFVTSKQARCTRDGVVEQQWLDDGSLQIFGGEQWKNRTFHRVQRVDTKGGHTLRHRRARLRDPPHQLHLPLRARCARACPSSALSEPAREGRGQLHEGVSEALAPSLRQHSRLFDGLRSQGD